MLAIAGRSLASIERRSPFSLPMTTPTSLAWTEVRTSTFPNTEVLSPMRISDWAARLAIWASCTGPAGAASLADVRPGFVSSAEVPVEAGRELPWGLAFDSGDGAGFAIPSVAMWAALGLFCGPDASHSGAAVPAGDAGEIELPWVTAGPELADGEVPANVPDADAFEAAGPEGEAGDDDGVEEESRVMFCGEVDDARLSLPAASCLVEAAACVLTEGTCARVMPDGLMPDAVAGWSGISVGGAGCAELREYGDEDSLMAERRAGMTGDRFSIALFAFAGCAVGTPKERLLVPDGVPADESGVLPATPYDTWASCAASALIVCDGAQSVVTGDADPKRLPSSSTEFSASFAAGTFCGSTDAAMSGDVGLAEICLAAETPLIPTIGGISAGG